MRERFNIEIIGKSAQKEGDISSLVAEKSKVLGEALCIPY